MSRVDSTPTCSAHVFVGVTTDLGCTDADLEVSATRTLTNDHPTCSAHVFVGVTTDLGYIDADLEVGAT